MVGLIGERLLCGFSLLIDGSPDVDEIIRDHAQSDPPLHSVHALIAAAVETVPPFQHANASFAAGSPLLSLFEPAFLLLAFEFGAFGGATGNGNTFHTFLLRDGYIPGRIESGIGGGRVGHATC